MAFSPVPAVNDPRSRRGFASMSAERQRALAAKGGHAVPAEKRTFSKDRDLASAAGRKGGLKTQAKQPAD